MSPADLNLDPQFLLVLGIGVTGAISGAFVLWVGKREERKYRQR
jgi:hypothetical protein